MIISRLGIKYQKIYFRKSKSEKLLTPHKPRTNPFVSAIVTDSSNPVTMMEQAGRKYKEKEIERADKGLDILYYTDKEISKGIGIQVKR
jgi:hypothetical protein